MRARRVVLVSLRTGRRVEVAAKTAARVPGEIVRRQAAIVRKSGGS